LVSLEAFLTEVEFVGLLNFAVTSEAKFRAIRVLAPAARHESRPFEMGQSKVLAELGHFHGLLSDRVKSAIPQVIQALGLSQPGFSRIEVRITASNDGDWLRSRPAARTDKHPDEIAFVCFFYSEPKGFSGGNMRVYDAVLENGRYVPAKTFKTIAPRGNFIVFFPTVFMHEIERVHCQSQSFKESLFTISGTIYR
jgi:SM-20-related protein